MSDLQPAIPNPRVPARPILSFDAFGKETSVCRSAMDAGHIKLTLNARTALALAMKHAGIGKGASILIPAYHCPAMVAPIDSLGIEPIFYPISPDTTVNADVLADRVKPDSRAVIAVHYFGFVQDMSPLREFCDERDLVLIEDCAHALFCSVDGLRLGAYGHYAIASLMKFLPIDQGGCLVSSGRSLDDLDLATGSLFFQLKSALNTVEMACEHGRLRWLSGLVATKNAIWKSLKGRATTMDRVPVAERDDRDVCAEYRFDPEAMNIRMSRTAAAIMNAMSFSRACEARRANYESLLGAFTGISGGRPLFSSLPEGVFPHVFPFLVDDPVRVFPALKARGVPIIRFGEYRWPGVDGSVCPVSDDLSRRVFQFPCHQALTACELEWMIQTVRSVL